MKDINLGRVLMENRRRRGITQEELAAYIGVSKAAVSKWETGLTYPDITLLPQLAAYFDISIDELMGYEPQMDKKEIRECYQRLAREFAVLPFEEALEHCRRMAKKYCSCYPLLFQLASLLVNHAMLAPSPEASGEILEEAKELFVRVKKETDNPSLGKQAFQMEVYCLMALAQPEETLALYEEDEEEIGPMEPLWASAYQMTGNTRAATRILQMGIYRQVMSLCNLFSCYLDLSADDPEKFARIFQRFEAVSDAFQLESLHPAILLSLYLMAAKGWASRGETEKALACLETYTDLATGNIYPLRLHGDSFFDQLEEWLGEQHLPRDEAVIRHSMTQALAENPAFTVLAGDPRFRNMVTRLKDSEEGN